MVRGGNGLLIAVMIGQCRMCTMSGSHGGFAIVICSVGGFGLTNWLEDRWLIVSR